MKIDQFKVLEAIKGMDLNIDNKDQSKIEYFLENGNPSQYYLELVCDVANVNIQEVIKNPQTSNNFGKPKGLTRELYKSFSFTD